MVESTRTGVIAAYPGEPDDRARFVATAMADLDFAQVEHFANGTDSQFEIRDDTRYFLEYVL